MTKYICIHGHFYQPPRINPWLETVEVQDQAAPYHDWNDRITAECYAPNQAARVLGQNGLIEKIVNNYSYISFNFGPTLLSWLEKNALSVHDALIEADNASIKRLGYGNAIAQVYNHVIMPLATKKDKLTQIRWGIKDFERRFGRKPLGMWLAETAVDTESLECLAQEGILFTILSPGQAKAIRPFEKDQWQDVSEGKIDPRRAYRVNLEKKLFIDVFFYDGPLSRAIAFEKLLTDGELLTQRLKGLFSSNAKEAQLGHIATDGESYGHHHAFGEMALAYTLNEFNQDPQYELTNYAAFLAKHPPMWEARIQENSSWSCAHGIKRWQEDCGCAIDPQKGWNQKWRTPLRKAMNELKEKLDSFFEKKGKSLFFDPWGARDDYVEVLVPHHQVVWPQFALKHLKKPQDAEKSVQAAKLLESQKWAMYMFTSCGWFFDELSGVEPVQNMRFAARSMELVKQLGAPNWKKDFVTKLSEAKSNIPFRGTGKDIWQKDVAHMQMGHLAMTACGALNSLAQKKSMPKNLYCYDFESLSHDRKTNDEISICFGKVNISHSFTHEKFEVGYAALQKGNYQYYARACFECEDKTLAMLSKDIKDPLALKRTAGIEAIFAHRIGGQEFNLAHLFLDERRKLVRLALKEFIAHDTYSAKSLYRARLEVLFSLRQMDVPVPPVYLALAEAICTEELINQVRLKGEEDLSDEIAKLAQDAMSLGLTMDSVRLKKALIQAISESIGEYQPGRQGEGKLAWAANLLILAQSLEITLDLWQAQNAFNDLLVSRRTVHGLTPKMQQLGHLLKFDLSQPPPWDV